MTDEFEKCKKDVLLALSLAHETDPLWTNGVDGAESRGHPHLRPDLLELLRLAELGLSSGRQSGVSGRPSGVDKYNMGLQALEAFDDALLLDPDNYELQAERDAAVRRHLTFCQMSRGTVLLTFCSLFCPQARLVALEASKRTRELRSKMGSADSRSSRRNSSGRRNSSFRRRDDGGWDGNVPQHK